MQKGSLLVAAVLLGIAAAPVRAQEGIIRIGLFDGVHSFTFSAATDAAVYAADGRDVGEVTPRESWRALRGEGDRVTLVDGSRRMSVTGPVQVVPRVPKGGVSLVYIGSHWYRGTLVIRPGLVAINDVDLEEYLYGVVPAEMAPSWPLEALKAQAVAARSYALANLDDHASHGYDLTASTDNKCYGGASMEHYRTNEAVNATRGEVLTYDGRVIPAYYCSAAGGYTDGAETVWLSKPVPYLKPVPDFDQDAPSYQWQATVPESQLVADLARHGISVGEPTSLEPLSRGYSGRVKILRIIGTRGDKDVSGENFRYYTGLKSSLFNVAPLRGDSGHLEGFAFAGRGHGHGLGMSQWGARTLGQMGYSYEQILEHYYPETELTTQEAALP